MLLGPPPPHFSLTPSWSSVAPGADHLLRARIQNCPSGRGSPKESTRPVIRFSRQNLVVEGRRKGRRRRRRRKDARVCRSRVGSHATNGAALQSDPIRSEPGRRRDVRDSDKILGPHGSAPYVHIYTYTHAWMIFGKDDKTKKKNVFSDDSLYGQLFNLMCSLSLSNALKTQMRRLVLFSCPWDIDRY